MPRPRFTLRWLMIAVAAIAVVLAVAPVVLRFTLRWNNSFRMAVMYRDSAMRLRTSAIAWREIEGCIPRPPTRITEARRDQMFQTAKEHDRMALKYERAARYPWLSVVPDPPEPE